MRKLLLLLLFVFLFPAQSRAQNFQAETVETDMLKLINEVRAEHSLPPLVQNWEATRVAKYKAEEMKKLNYAAHESPVHGNPAEMLNKYGIPFKIVGENIASGQNGTRGVVNEWVNTPAYRDNILSGLFRESGIGYCRDGVTGDSNWVLLFIS